MKSLLTHTIFIIYLFGTENVKAQKITRYTGLSNFDKELLTSLKSKKVDTILFFKLDSCLKFKPKEILTSYEKYEREVYTVAIWVQNGRTHKRMFRDSIEISNSILPNNSLIDRFFESDISLKKENRKQRQLFQDRRIGFMNVNQNFYFINFYYNKNYFLKAFTEAGFNSGVGQYSNISPNELIWIKDLEKELTN